MSTVAANAHLSIDLTGSGSTFSVANNFSVSRRSYFNTITVASGTDCSMRLPSIPSLGEQFLFKNDTSVQVNIFPDNNSASQIDALGVGVQFRLPANSQCALIPVSSDGAATPAVQWHHVNQYGQPSVLSSVTALAAGAQASSVAPAQGIFTYVVSTCATSGDSIALPRTTAVLLNKPLLIANLGVASLAVWPSNTSADNSLINNYGANVAAWLGPGASAHFVAVSTASGVVQWLMHGYAGPKPVVVLAATPATITRGMSGAAVLVNVATGTYTLPAVAGSQGCNYKFVNGTSGAGSLQIINAAAGTPVFGVAIGGTNAALTSRAGAGTLSVRFSTSSAEGDSIDLLCDGTHWHAQAFSSSNTAATSVIFA